MQNTLEYTKFMFYDTNMMNQSMQQTSENEGDFEQASDPSKLIEKKKGFNM